MSSTLNPVRMRGWRSRAVEDRLKRVQTYPWSSYRACARAGVKDGSSGIACDRVWGELGARTEREGRKRYREYIRNWLVKEEKGKPASQRDDSERDPLRGVRLGCFLGGDQFRDFIQGILGGENEIDQELVGHRQWRKELPIDDLLVQVAQVRKTAPEDLLTSRKPHVERDVAMYLCREVGQKPLREIAQRFGVKYSAVSVACKRMHDHASGDKHFAKRLTAYKNAMINLFKT